MRWFSDMLQIVPSTAAYYYDIVPERGKDKYPVMSFSTDNGVLAADLPNVLLTLQCSEPFTPADETANSYKYRIPCMSTLRILVEKDELFRGRYAIFQFGKTMSLVP